MNFEQVMEKFVNDETILEYKSLIKKIEDKARREGYKEGRVSVLKNINVEIAKNLLNDHIDISVIMKSTGLSKQEILKLQESI